MAARYPHCSCRKDTPLKRLGWNPRSTSVALDRVDVTRRTTVAVAERRQRLSAARAPERSPLPFRN